MRKPDHMPSFAAGHALIAAALGLSMLFMLPIAILPFARLLGWLIAP